MAFLVEDGSAVPNATSLSTVEAADEYHNNLQNLVWAGLEMTAKQALLIKASSYFSASYNRRLSGTRKTATQTFHYPAVNAYYNDTPITPEFRIADDIVPNEVLNAVAELALIANSQSLVAPVANANSGQVQTLSRRRLGPLEISSGYSASRQSSSINNPFPATTAILYRLLRPLNKRVIR